jgi:oligopeptide/dipeptide ABC transporter ATP-binding protein
MMRTMAIKLDVRELTVELPTPSGWVRPVNGVSFSLREGETIGIVGESGSGKTMLSLALMGLLPPGARTRGEAWLQSPGDGENSVAKDLLAASSSEMRRVRGRRIAMIFQEPMTALNPVLRVGAQVAEAIRAHEHGLSAKEVDERVLAALERAAVPEPARRARQYPHELSGGLRQRVTIAIALAAGPDVLIADEPTTALDVTVQKQILDLLEHLRRELRISMLFITHDLGVVARVADRIAVMYAGRTVEEGATTEVLRHAAHPYTAGLLQAAPRLKREKLMAIPGAAPALDALPQGCSFAPRCARRIPDCNGRVPDLARVSATSETHLARCIRACEVA